MFYKPKLIKKKRGGHYWPPRFFDHAFSGRNIAVSARFCYDSSTDISTEKVRIWGTYLLSLDQGTTSSRAILFDREQNILGVSQKEFTQCFPRDGWVEHNAMEIWSSQYAVMMEIIAQTGISPKDIAAIGITNQRETTILWDRATGQPIYNAIVWQCRRTADIVDELVQAGLDEHIRKTTGLIPDAYFSATKIKWILDQWRGRGRRPDGARCSSGRWTAGCCGS